MAEPQITLLTKPGCHLCDDARSALHDVLAEAEFADAVLPVDEKNILDDAELTAEYAEEIPVVLIDGRVHTIWRVEPERLRTALRAAFALPIPPIFILPINRFRWHALPECRVAQIGRGHDREEQGDRTIDCCSAHARDDVDCWNREWGIRC